MQASFLTILRTTPYPRILAAFTHHTPTQSTTGSARGVAGIRRRIREPLRRSDPTNWLCFARKPGGKGRASGVGSLIPEPRSPAELALFRTNGLGNADLLIGIALTVAEVGFVLHPWLLPGEPTPRRPILPKFGFVLRDWHQMGISTTGNWLCFARFPLV